METISYRQSVFLLSMILPVTGHMLLLPPILNLSGNNAWLAILLTVPIGFLFAFILFRLHKLQPNKTLVQLMEQAFGQVIGKILTVGLLGYFIFMLIISLYALFDYFQVIFLPEIPKWMIASTFYLVVLYAIRIGIEGMTRVSETLFLIIIVTGTSIGIATQPMKNYDVLLPLFADGWKPVLSGIFITTALYGEFVILTMLTLKRDTPQSKSLLFTNFVLVILVLIMFIGTTISSLTIFGEEQAKILEYPAQSIVRLVSFGFIERFDIYGVFVMTVGSVIRMATFQSIFNLGIRQWLGMKKKWWIHGITTITVFFIACKMIENHRQFVEIYLTKYYSLTAIISIGLPMLTWIVLEIKHRLRKKNA